MKPCPGQNNAGLFLTTSSTPTPLPHVCVCVPHASLTPHRFRPFSYNTSLSSVCPHESKFLLSLTIGYDVMGKGVWSKSEGRGLFLYSHKEVLCQTHPPNTLHRPGLRESPDSSRMAGRHLTREGMVRLGGTLFTADSKMPP